MKVKKLKKFQNKMGLKGCKWSSLNGPGTETPLSYYLMECYDRSDNKYVIVMSFVIRGLAKIIRRQLSSVSSCHRLTVMLCKQKWKTGKDGRGRSEGVNNE